MIRTIAMAMLLAGCPKSSSKLDLGMTPRAGRLCSGTTVGFADVEVKTVDLACHVVMTFDLAPAGQITVAMPPPSGRSGRVAKTVRADGVVRRRVEVGDARARADSWRIRLADDGVGPAGMTLAEASDYRFADHWVVVFVLSDTARSGTVFPFPVHPGTSAHRLWDADPRWCAEDLAASVQLFPATDGRVQDRVRWSAVEALKDLPVACSHTHAHVFAVDLGGLGETALDVKVELNNRSPRLFRLIRDPEDNLTIVDVIVEPLE